MNVRQPALARVRRGEGPSTGSSGEQQPLQRDLVAVAQSDATTFPPSAPGADPASTARLSGKAPNNIGRAATYAARHAAKNVVAAGLAEQCLVQMSYSIGQTTPVSVEIETYRTAKIAEDQIRSLVVRRFDLRPAAIVRRFNPRHLPSAVIPAGFYQRLAAYGQVGGSDMELPWERLDLVEALRGR